MEKVKLIGKMDLNNYDLVICCRKDRTHVVLIPYASKFKLKDLKLFNLDDAYFDADKQIFVGIKKSRNFRNKWNEV